MSTNELAKHELKLLAAYRRLYAACPKQYRAERAKTMVRIINDTARRMDCYARKVQRENLAAERALAEKNGERARTLNALWATAAAHSNIDSANAEIH